MSSNNTGSEGVDKLEGNLIQAMKQLRQSKAGKSRLQKVVKTYLSKTSEGKSVVKEITEQPLLLVISSDGWLDVYGSPRIQPAFYSRLPMQGSAEARKIAEEILEAQMPIKHRDIYWPHAVGEKPGLIAVNHIGLAPSGTGQMAYKFLHGRKQWVLRNGQMTTMELLEETNTICPQKKK